MLSMSQQKLWILFYPEPSENGYDQAHREQLLLEPRENGMNEAPREQLSNCFYPEPSENGYNQAPREQRAGLVRQTMSKWLHQM
jgi:hypothetical protein